jgi:hypothetical protein
MTKPPSKLMIISYRAGTPSDVLAEFADDKIRFSQKFGMKTYVITALGANVTENNSLKIFRVPSISHKDFNLELEILQNSEIPKPKWIKFYKLIPNTFGRLFDGLYKAINGDLGHARWSWSVTAALVAIYVKIVYSVKHAFTIGSATAYLVGLILRKVTHVKLYVEVPDPLIGSEMGRSKIKSSLLIYFEKVLIKNSIRYFLITKKVILT